MKDLEQTFFRHVAPYLKPNMKLIVAVSGGADSMCLLALLAQLSENFPLDLFAAHLNHGLRKEADSEESLVRDFCLKRGIPFYAEKQDIRKLSAERGIGEELCGRQERYAYFEALRKKLDADWIVTAHHRDDQAESILLHLLRGCGPDGMVGMRTCGGTLFRPLLPFRKTELVSYCVEKSIPYCNDASNSDEKYLRNRIRHRILPLLEESNPGFSACLTENAVLFREDTDYLDALSAQAFQCADTPNGLSLTRLSEEPLPIRRRMIQLLYQKNSGNRQKLALRYIDAILALSKSGQRVDLPGGFCCIRGYQTLSCEKRKDCSEYAYTLIENQPCCLPEAGITVLWRRFVPGDSLCFFASEDDTVMIRNAHAGDRFFPTGMEGRKKLSDYFTDRKIPRELRAKIPILTVSGEIAAIIGYRNDRRFFKKTPTDPKKIQYTLEIQAKK